MLNSSLAFVADKMTLNIIDRLVYEEGLIDDMVVSFDSSDEDKSEMNIYVCETDDHTWIDIYKIEERINENYPNMHFEVIYASTDSESYVEVISTNGSFDVYLSEDNDRMKDLCSSYSLEFYSEPEEESWDEEEGELDADY